VQRNRDARQKHDETRGSRTLSDSERSEQDLRVLIVTGTFLPVVGGLEIATHRLAERLIQRGVTVSLVTSRREADWPVTETLNTGLEVFRLRQERVPLVGTALYMVRLAAFLWRRRREYDVVHTCSFDPSTFASALMRRLTRRPTVCRLSCAEEEGDIARLNRYPLRALWRRLLDRIDVHVALSEQIEGELVGERFQWDRIRRIPNGVDTDHFRPASEAERAEVRERLNWGEKGPLVVFVGRLSAQKSPSDLLAAFQRVVREEPGGLLLLVGDGPLRESLKSQAHELGISENVRLVGNVDNVRDYLHAADLFAMPSRAEGMSNAVLEAMACGLPCVGTGVSGTTELFGENEAGRVISLGQPDQLSEAILALWRSPEEARRLGAAAAEKVRSLYSLDAVVGQYLELYRESLGERDTPPGEQAAGKGRGNP